LEISSPHSDFGSFPSGDMNRSVMKEEKMKTYGCFYFFCSCHIGLRIFKNGNVAALFSGQGWINQAKPAFPANFDQQNNCNGRKINLKIGSPRSDFGSYPSGDMNRRVTKEKKK